MEDEKLVVQIHVDLSLADAANLRRICEAKNVTKSDYIRQCIRNSTYELDNTENFYVDSYDFYPEEEETE